MLPKKIERKIKELCEGDVKKYELLISLLEYEDSGKGKQNQNCEYAVEKYAEEKIGS